VRYENAESVLLHGARNDIVKQRAVHDVPHGCRKQHVRYETRCVVEQGGAAVRAARADHDLPQWNAEAAAMRDAGAAR